MKILANDGISPVGQQMLEEAGFTVITEKVSQDALINHINAEGIEILLVRSATTARKELIDACPNLKLIGRGGVGMDNIDVEYARGKGVHVINTPGSSSQSVAELVMGHMFATSRFLNDSYKNMENGDFSTLKKAYGKGMELRGKTLGIVGFGRIGQSLASYALGIGMKVIAIDNTEYTVAIPIAIGEDLEFEVSITTHTDLHANIGSCDFISLHVPKQKDGSAVIGHNEFNLMKPSVRLINAARGGVIDENALLEALDSKKIAYCALDVFENEPFPNKALLAHSKIATTPHIGAATEEAQERIGAELADQIISVFVKA